METARGVGTHHRGHAVVQHPLGGDLGELGLPELVVRLGRHLRDHLLGLLGVLELEQARLEPRLVAVRHRLHALFHDAFGGQLLGLRVPVHVLGRRLPLGARDDDGAATRGAGTDARGGRAHERRGGDASEGRHRDDGNVRVVSRAGALETFRRSGRARAGVPSGVRASLGLVSNDRAAPIAASDRSELSRRPHGEQSANCAK